MNFRQLLPLLGAVASLCATAAGASNANNVSAEPLLPSQDPFYQPPYSAWYATRPGTILKSRKVTIGSATPGMTTPLKAAYQLQFRSTNVHGDPAIAITTVLIPNNANYSRLASYQVAYDSPDNNCSPSYGLQFESSVFAGEAITELALANIFLSQGVVVSMPDYEGVNAALLVGPQTAFTVLDSIRATLNSHELTGVDPQAITTLVGYSGGSFAGEWAAEYASSYAPDLPIGGVAIGGLPVKILSALKGLQGTANAGLIAAGTLGIANAIPSFARSLNANLKPQNASRFMIPLAQCQGAKSVPGYGYGPSLAYTTINDFVDNGDAFVASQQNVLDSIGVMGRHGVPQFPMLIWKGTADEVVPTIQDTDDLVNRFCTLGASVQYYRVINGTHGSSIGPGLPYAINFIQSIYNGTMLSRNCTIKDIPLS